MTTTDPTPSQSAKPGHAPRWRGRWAWLLSAALGALLLAAAAWGLSVWSGTSGSLASAIQWAGWFLPAHQQLNASQITGSLKQGGRIGQLHWQKEGLSIRITDADVRLDWSKLWDHRLPVTDLRVGTLSIHQRPATASTPPTSLTLPLTVQMAWQVDQVRWQDMAEPVLTDLRGQYGYDGQQHTLSVDTFQMAMGRYTLQAQLQAMAPMALNLQWQGQVQVPGKSGQNGLTLALQASVQGTLSGDKAQLAVLGQLVPTSKTSSPSPTPGAAPAADAVPPVHLNLQAQIQPWQAQAVVQADIEGQGLDMAALWPGAPQTHLDGKARVHPDGEGWQLDGQWRNLTPGPWDQQRLPLSKLDVQASYQNGLWQVTQAKAQIGPGQVQAQASQTTSGWTGRVDVRGLLPAQLHTALAGPPVQGQLIAEDTGAGKIELQADLHTWAPGASRPTRGKATASDRLIWERLQIQGQWQAQAWDIRNFTLEAEQARLQAQFKFHPQGPSLQGEAQLNLPGLQAQLQGLMAPASGQGQLVVVVQEAAQSLNWLQRWPGLATTLKGFKASGPGQLQADWQGGFQQADTAVKLSAKLPRLDYPSASKRPWQFSAGQLQVQGTLKALQAQAQMNVAQDGRTGSLKTSLSAHRSDATTDEWQGHIQQVSIDLPGTTGATPWRAELQKPWPWQARLNPLQRGLRWQEASWLLQGPTPGTARLMAEAGQWQMPAAGGAAQAQAAARWEDLPLSWLPGVLSPEVQSDVMLQGQWQLRTSPSLSMSASVQRSRGDLRIHADNAPGQRLPAGLREARLQLNVQGEQLQADLIWDSEQLGQVKAQAQSRLSQTPLGWQWDEDAPLQGALEASLPKIAAWSVLAPPGWRVQGTLESRLALSGTRRQPQWQGHVQANNLAVRSAVEGIEFSQGQLRARVEGQSVVLERLSLRGAGAQGGELQASGQIGWRSQDAAWDSARPLQTARLLLQIQAKGLRVSNRADRRLAITGDVTADMDQGQLRLKGLVRADQALFILPEENAPSLGSDVVVLRDEPVTPTPVSPGPPRTSWLSTPDVEIQLDLGPDFRVQGRGLNTRLSGQVMLVSNAATRGQPRLTGQVRTEGGRYKAYGQQLIIETGVLRFNGPYDNPSLDITALRPNLPQRVGVQVTGTALLPRVRLYADPDMPDADKLAWLVLGRSAASGGAESAVLQQAALALLSGNGKTLSGELASSLGLDEISLASGSRSDANATGAAVTFGKRLSKDFYMVYESSLSGTFGSLYIFYDLSQRLTLRAQAGQQSALDLIFTVRKD